ncbi:hypothetical protein VP01_3390g1 [Puccinia sorghi]|uniref:Integrase catalytic domain-containing protein n=1 Tax=Puccinia sorghi TaxID=27349 RepID=A0A0L6UWS0_9BASI|nr:hypothetical protein VP01_3390g1 [Puccinia sorghi]
MGVFLAFKSPPECWREAESNWEASKKANYFMSLITLWIKNEDHKSKIIINIGSSLHVLNDKKKDANLAIKGMGQVIIMWGKMTIVLENCLYVPIIVVNLVSLGLLDKKGCKNLEIFSGQVHNNMYSLETPERHYEKYAHASLQQIKPILPQSFTKSELKIFECKACVLSKITKQSFNLESRPASKFFDRKDDMTNVLINLLEVERKRLGYLPTMICSDRGCEFIGSRLVDYMDKNHIQRLMSEPYHPEHNGRAKRPNRTVVEAIHATFCSSGIPKSYWHELFKSCGFTLNQI